ncbi:SAM-dependent methyltransferase [Streptomyces sp. NPDC004134]|uniref:SAM-dependent methyltransferase n=1 Tax=Streptomyces sp. NPDC004134 TaxID=3364691 RepID=UPI0036B4689A
MGHDALPPDGSGSPIDATVPHSARIWNYWLGGKDNYAPDREMGDRIAAYFPEIRENARGNRRFLDRAVRYLVGEAGIRQFLDIGTGLPTASNTHDVAQGIAPECRIVYVDNDPLVLAHARALLNSAPEGATAYLDADVRDPRRILAGAAVTLDLTRPVALVLCGVLQFVQEDATAHDIVTTLLNALPPGSHLVLTHPTSEVRGERMEAAVRQWNEGGGNHMVLRDPAQVTRFFDGLDLLPPGVVPTTLWRPAATDIGTPDPIDDFGGLARKP